MTALFGSSAVAASKNLVEFRAGKMSLKGTTVTADKRKGLVYVYQSDDSLMHFCWKDRTAGTLEDDLIIFPDDVEFKRVSQCTTGRVYILKFKSSSRKFFFWMQEPKDDKDEENCKKVNEVLNNPPTPGSQTSGAGEGLPAGLSGLQPALASLGDQLGDTSLQSLLNNMDENQLMQLLGMGSLGGAMLDSHPPSRSNNASAAATRASAGSAATTRPQSNAANTTSGSTPTTTTATSQSASSEKKGEGDNKAATTGSQPAVQLSDLQNILSNMQVPAQQESVDLSSSFSTEALIPLLSDKDVQTRLKPFLPVVDNLPESSEELKQTLQSPQFKQALSVFSAALQSGQLAPLMQQFKLNQSATDAAAKGDIIAFVKALQENEAASDVKVEDEVEDMALD